MTAASEDVLKSLHNALAQDLLRRLQSGEATAADLNVVRQFLKDNNISADGAKSPLLGALVDSLPFAADDAAEGSLVPGGRPSH